MLLHLQNEILEMVAKGAGLAATAERLCRAAESMCPGVVCSLLSVDRSGLLHPIASPSLPAAYSAALDGLVIGPNTGSCGTAAYMRQSVVVTDIATDARWASYRHLALPVGLRACWSSPILDERGEVLGTFAFYASEERGPSQAEEDIVAACVHLCAIALEREERVTERERRASVDALTGLANRGSFDAALAHLSCDEPGAWALLMIDIDDLKITNDTFGHQAGDALLQAVATRIATACAPDKAFRLGGDEFAVILQAPAALREIEATANHILELIGAPAACGGNMIAPRATIGGAILTKAMQNPEDLRQDADFALYHAKAIGRGGFVRYWTGIGSAITKRVAAIRDVRAALDEQRIDAHYQPVVRLDTREIVGVEALCRLTTPKGEVVAAGEFYDALADTHIASAITGVMLSRIAADVRSWLERGIPFQHVGINVTSADFHRGKLYEQIAAAFHNEHVPLDHVIVEVTEGVYLGKHDQIVAHEIKTMRANGLRVALDDFGTGFASLTHLLTVPIDILKIDKSFVDRLTLGEPGHAIVEGLFLIARKLGIRVVAEGIETEEQARQLTQFGCVLGQGYLFSQALDRDAMTAALLRYVQKSDGVGKTIIKPTTPTIVSQEEPFAERTRTAARR